eukprot:12922904-Prorocentrum_lima.AAC.1
MESLSVEASARLTEKEQTMGRLEQQWTHEVEENKRSKLLKEEVIRKARLLADNRMAEAAAAKRSVEQALR